MSGEFLASVNRSLIEIETFKLMRARRPMQPWEAEVILRARFELLFTQHHRRFCRGQPRGVIGTSDLLMFVARARGWRGDPVLELLTLGMGDMGVMRACEILFEEWDRWRAGP